MANTLNFTSNVNLGNLNKAKINAINQVDEDAQRMVVEVNVLGSQAPFFATFALEIRNGSCQGLAAHPVPGSVGEAMVRVALTGAGVASAFDTVLAAYHAAGGDKRGNVLTALKGITGVVVGGPLDGQTVPALPAGTVS